MLIQDENKNFQKFNIQDFSDANNLNKMAIVELQKSNPQYAQQVFERSRSIDPHNVLASFLSGSSLINQEKYQEADERVAEVIQNAPIRIQRFSVDENFKRFSNLIKPNIELRRDLVIDRNLENISIIQRENLIQPLQINPIQKDLLLGGQRGLQREVLLNNVNNANREIANNNNVELDNKKHMQRLCKIVHF